MSQVNKVLIITKYRFIGDTLTAIPTIRAVKEQWPAAQVSILTGARACELLQNSPYIDNFIEFDPYRSSDQGLKAYLKLLMKLRKQKFDLCLVLNRSFHSALTSALGDARSRVGWAGFEGRDFLLSARCMYDKEKPEIDCFLDVFRTASWSEPSSRRLELWLSQDELASASTLLPATFPVIGLQPGATHHYKQWPVENFVDLAETLIHKDSSAQIVLIGGAEESPIAESFLASASTTLVARTKNLVGNLSLRKTLAVVAQLTLFVGNDTAIRHSAVALDTPSVGIFGPTSCSKWGNAAPPRHIVVQSPTGLMEGVSVEAVNEIADALCTGGSESPEGSIAGRQLHSSTAGTKV